MKKPHGYVYTLPIALWISIFFVIPTMIVFAISFLKKGIRGGVEWTLTTGDLVNFLTGHFSELFSKLSSMFTFDAYRSLLHPAFIKVAGVTVFISIAVTIITLCFAIPTAYYIARSKKKNLLLLLVIIPFWTNLLIRIFAWISILGNNGYLNTILIHLGISDTPIQFLYSRSAVIIVTVYTSLPYAILPLYSTIEKFDFSLLEAARDLGASKAQSMFKVFIPNIRAGIITAVLFTFIPALGSYAVPQLVGGTDSSMIGNVIARELTVNRNWPLASSMSLILTIITMVGILIFMNINQTKTAQQKLETILSKRGSDG